jgi:hypothetical protein
MKPEITMFVLHPIEKPFTENDTGFFEPSEVYIAKIQGSEKDK